jgi:hypothetical protein
MVAVTQGNKHHDDHATHVLSDAEPALVVRGQNQSTVKKSLVEIGEVQSVLIKVGEALRFVP